MCPQLGMGRKYPALLPLGQLVDERESVWLSQINGGNALRHLGCNKFPNIAEWRPRQVALLMKYLSIRHMPTQPLVPTTGMIQFVMDYKFCRLI